MEKKFYFRPSIQAANVQGGIILAGSGSGKNAGGNEDWYIGPED